MSRKRWLLLYAAAILAAVIAGFNDHGLIPGLPSSIIGSILNQLVKTVGLLGVGDMVLYFREREAHDRTKQELDELRAAQQQRDVEQQQRDADLRVEQQQRDADLRVAQQQRDAAQQKRDEEQRAAQQQRDAAQQKRDDEQRAAQQQQSEIISAMLEQMRLLQEDVRLLRSENRNGNGSGNPDGNSGDALS